MKVDLIWWNHYCEVTWESDAALLFLIKVLYNTVCTYLNGFQRYLTLCFLQLPVILWIQLKLFWDLKQLLGRCVFSFQYGDTKEKLLSEGNEQFIHFD